MKEDWSIFNIVAAQSLVTYHPMTVLTLPKFFMLYSFEMLFLSHFNTQGFLEVKKKLSTYMLIIMVAPSLLDLRILGSAFSGLNLRVLRKPMTF